jgi:hypothetical protein
MIPVQRFQAHHTLLLLLTVQIATVDSAHDSSTPSGPVSTASLEELSRLLKGLHARGDYGWPEAARAECRMGVRTFTLVYKVSRLGKA